MIAIVRKNLSCLILKRTSSPVCGSPPVSLSFYLHFFSTSGESIRPGISDILLNKYDFPPELASRVASKFTDLENPEKVDSVLSFFKDSGFSNIQLAKILKYKPRFLAANVEDTLKPKIKIFQNLGFSSDAICKILSANPSIMHLSVNNNIIPSLCAMNELLGSNNKVAKVISRSPRFLSVNLESTLVPNVEVLKSCGVSVDSINTILTLYPCPFTLRPEVLKKSAEKVKEMGLHATSKNFMYAISAIASMRNEAWELKLQAFRDMGFSDSDISTMFKKSPRMILGSMEKKRKIKELLLSTGKFNLFSIVNFPISLLFSIEKRYKPRFQILGVLESRKLIKKWPELATICRLSDYEFFKKYIRSYLNEVGNVDVINDFIDGKKEMKHEAL